MLSKNLFPFLLEAQVLLHLFVIIFLPPTKMAAFCALTFVCLTPENGGFVIKSNLRPSLKTERIH